MSNIKFNVGDRVQTTRHNFIGRIKSFEHLDLDDSDVQEWLSIQSIPVSQDERVGLWATVLVEPVGAIQTPVSCLSVVK